MVVHCAGVTAARRGADFLAVNAEGTERLARSAAESGVRRLVFISSLAARGPDGHAGPVSPYGRSKREAEERLLALADRLEIVILRPSGIYGPRDTDMLPLFRMAKRGFVLGPRGETRLQPVFVEDVAEAVVRALGREPCPDALPVAEAATYGWDEVARGLAVGLERSIRLIRLPFAVFWTAGFLGEVGGRIARRPAALDRRRARDLSRYSWTCDTDPTEARLGWRARVALPEGMERTARWYEEHGWL